MFQEVDLASAFASVAEWSQTVLGSENATELMALALTHAIVQRDVAHLIVPDGVEELPGLDGPPASEKVGRLGDPEITPPARELDKTSK